MKKYKGMTLLDFINMWEGDGTKMTEQQRQSLNGHTWILYNIKYPEPLPYRDRHSALILKVDKKTKIILLQIPFIGEEVVNQNYYNLLEDWFNENVEKYGKV